MHTPISLKTIILASSISFVILIGIGFLFLKDYNVSIQKKTPDGVACTMEAKICPDGSAVGRMPPSCEFAPCPAAGGQTRISPEPTIPDDAGNMTPGGTGTASTAPIMPGQSAMSKIPDLPLGNLQEPSPPLSVKYVVEHRSALNEKRIAVTGIIVRNALEEQTCPTGRMCALMYQPPQIAIADTALEPDSNYHITIIMPETARSQFADYPVGKSISILATVEGSREGITMRTE